MRAVKMQINKNGIPVEVLNEKTMALTKVGSPRLKVLIDAWRKHGMESFGPGGISTDEVMRPFIGKLPIKSWSFLSKRRTPRAHGLKRYLLRR